MPVPIIDLFAGPGGLGEGFSSIGSHDRQAFFEIGLSIEKDSVAHRTLTLRAVFRRLRGTESVKHYYDFIRGKLSEEAFRNIPVVADAFAQVAFEARCLELGKSDEEKIDNEIRDALKGEDTWVLIGGPPCQAYSLAGRARRAKDKEFYNDEKHFLYKEYLRIIRKHKPTIFVMENVKGLLSSKHSGNPMFEKIISDLSNPADGLEYEIRSFTKVGNSNSLQPTDFIIHSECYGIPQSRHRVILLGVRKDLHAPQHELLKPIPNAVTVKQAINDLPRIRSRLSRNDSLENWLDALKIASSYVKGWGAAYESKIIESMDNFVCSASNESVGGSFITSYSKKVNNRSTELERWLHDSNLGGVCQHESRSHMATDLARYLFSASFAHLSGHSPTLDIFPVDLLPDHLNVYGEKIPFKDRFRVQCSDEPAATVVAHIAKDGHYYIHYDPSQCRSLTVREAARLQTFPDNYFFVGNRTEQYTQVGNAVPPLLARKLARIVRNLLSEMGGGKSSRNADIAQNNRQEMSGQSYQTSFSHHVLAEAS